MASRSDKFTVDTHLFRELGELLVGRDSTALIELIKNSYDADATRVVVFGEHLEDPARGQIIISDNGTGMTPERFRTSFLRVASRLKDSGDRRSGLLHRRFTGAKGIGRLAAHKLARHIQVESTPHPDIASGPRRSVTASIDWDAVERLETLDQIAGTGAIQVDTAPAVGALSGTTLTLTRLRRRWTPTERARFFAEVQSFNPPDFFTRPLRKETTGTPLLFGQPLVRLSDEAGTEFVVQLKGDFEAGEEYWRLLERHAAWVIEIRCRPGDPEVHYVVAPSKKTLKEYPDAKRFSIDIEHPDPVRGPFFDARIFVRVGVLKSKRNEKAWASRASGVRVYMEGFRVLPYGEPGNDWLRLDADYTRRSRSLETLERWGIQDEVPGDDKDHGLSAWPSNNLFGAVFLVHENAQHLRALVNREGFVPDAPFDHLASLVRTGVDLCTRSHAAATFASRERRRLERKRAQQAKTQNDKPSGTPAPQAELKGTLDSAAATLAKVRAHVLETASDDEQTSALVEEIGETIERVRGSSEGASELISEQALLRVLASVGTQMSAFVHEIRGLLAGTQTVERALVALQADPGLRKPQRQQLGKVQRAVGELRRALEREASYLTDIVSPDARRRRSRQKLAEQFDATVRLVEHAALRRGVRIENRIPSGLKTSAMFPAELMAVFSNLLTNAVKAAGSGGYVFATAAKRDGKVVFRMENTGARIDIAESEKWFRPFESTTEAVDPVLGQGMGLGLSITRRLLEDYDADIRFVEPSAQFATCVEVTFDQ